MKVHSKSPPPPGVHTENSNEESDSSGETSPPPSSNANTQTTNGNATRTTNGTFAAVSLANSTGTNLSEWYVCQSSGGMPTPPSNEPSPVATAVKHVQPLGIPTGNAASGY